MHIDGDVIRAVFDDDLGHSLEDRKKNAARICRLGKFLSDNGMLVICSVSQFQKNTENGTGKTSALLRGIY